MAPPRPFRFAVQAHAAAHQAKASTAAEWRQLARRVEVLGYSTLFVADHYLDRGRAPQYLAPIRAMAVAAASHRGAQGRQPGLLERRERYGVSYVTFPEAIMEDLAPLVGRLAGR
jgi:hypothetical protein